MQKTQGFKKLAFCPVLPLFLLLNNRESISSIVFSAEQKTNQDENISFQSKAGFDYILPYPLFFDLKNERLKKWRHKCFS